MPVLRIEPHMIDRLVWSIQDLLEKAAEASPETPESLIALGRIGQADFWLAYEGKEPLGLCVSQVLQKPKERVVSIVAIGGSRGTKWLRELREVVKADGMEMGATKATMYRVSGRKCFYGLKPVGYYYEDVF